VLQCRYGFICNESGGIIDDQIVYRLDEQTYFMVVNAGTQDNDFRWVQSHLSGSSAITNISEETAKIDLQGPLSAKIMQRLMENPIDDMKFYWAKKNRYGGKEILTSRTGYTGEIGFEIYTDRDTALKFWNDCMELGAKPAGLGARDTLRLEMGMPLYGHELGEKRNAVESGLSRAIATNKRFIGSEQVLNPANVKQALVGIILDGRRAARAEDPVVDSNGQVIGTITSGSFSPSIGKAIALAYINKTFSKTGTIVQIRSDKAALSGTVSALPFYKTATGRRLLKEFLQ
jgi:aminomethyltransferase